MTAFAELKTPTSFLSPLKLMPVLPPTEASTIARSVVGMLMNWIPRLKVEAANPPRSVTIPPPRLINREWRVAPMLPSSAQTLESDSMFLLSSFALIVIMRASFNRLSLFINGRQCFSVFSSVSMKMLS